MKRYPILLILLLVSCSSCQTKIEIVQSPDCIYAPNSDTIIEIPGQKLDIESCRSMNFGNNKDRQFAASLPANVVAEVLAFSESHSKSDCSIFSARQIGNYIIMVISESDPKGSIVADGGFEIVYSITLKKVVGIFMASPRG